jgi:thiol-disulfide isomerase/thioredoxin
MKKNNTKLMLPIVLGLVVLLAGSFSKGIADSQPPEEIKRAETENNKKISVFKLSVPQIDLDKTYLGLTGTGAFKLNQIKTQILIIEIFNFYCPHCQQSAPMVNTLYRDIQEKGDIRDKIKIIGLGVGNSAYEINLFKQKYQVPFPLFPDPDNEVAKTFGVKATPTFVGIRFNEQGVPEQFFFQECGFDDAPKFLNDIIKQSGLK